ncbi:MAG: hypothetical protein H6706_30585 [Myxococcales bacterium]|nr:hypothetical protein [Myxococcales bacterium]
MSRHLFSLRFSWVLALAVAGCDEAGQGGADAGGACTSGALVAQCPPGTNPILGAQAVSACEGAAGGVVLDGQGQATGQCYGQGSCRVACQFAVPCRCGVASVGRDGVACAPCDGAASCGNGACEGGETPANCPIDCGSTCEADERRCDGEVLEVCNLQGRWERLPCPQGEACVFGATPGSAACERDPGIIGGADGGVVTDGGVVEDGRLIPGDGSWPDGAVGPAPTAPFPRQLQVTDVAIRLDDGSVQNRPTPFAQLMSAAGSRFLWRWRLMPGDPIVIEGFGRASTLRVDERGGVFNVPRVDYPRATPEQFCAAYAACNGPVPPEQCAATMAPYLDARFVDPEWLVDCLAANAAEDCDLFLFFAPTCAENPHFPLPEGTDLVVNEVALVGDRLLGGPPDRSQMVAIDLASGELHRQEPLPGYLVGISTEGKALSADGRVAVGIGQQGNDSLLVVWDIDRGVRRAVQPMSGNGISRMAVGGDGRVLATVGSSDDPAVNRLIVLWNLEEERRIVSIRPPENEAQQGFAVLEISPDGRLLVVDVDQQTALEVWELGQRPQKIQVLDPGGNDRISQVAFAPDGRTLAVVQGAGPLAQISLWDAVDGQRWRTEPVSPGEVREVRFSDDGRRLLTLRQDGTLAFYFKVFGP